MQRVVFDQSWQDAVALVDFMERNKSVEPTTWFWRVLSNVGLVATSTFLIVMVVTPLFMEEAPIWYRIGMPLGFVLFYTYMSWTTRRWKGTLLSMHKVKAIQNEYAWNGDAYRNLHLSCTPEGVTLEMTTESRTWRWTAIERIETTAEHLFFFDTPSTAITVPRSAFESEVASEAFIQSAREWWRQARDGWVDPDTRITAKGSAHSLRPSCID